MKSKACTLHAISLCLLPLLTAGCLSDNLLSDHPGTPTGPVEIQMKSHIAGSTAKTRADDGKGMMSTGKAFNVQFARVDENADDTSYPDTYKADAIAGAVSTANVLTFTDQYYLSNGKKTKLIGWYPAGATYTQTGRTVAFSDIDGETDIMVTTLKEGSKETNNQIKNITFSHLLMQISVKVYTTDANNKTFWGGIKSITIAGKKQTCTVTLPATSASADAKATAAFTGSNALSLIKKNPKDNTDIKQGDTSVYGDSNPLELGDSKDNAVLAGYAMFAPADNDAISLTVVTEKGGTQTVSVSAPQSGGFVAGGSYIIPLCFGVSTISPTGTSITDWSTSTELPEITV